jgi:cobalt-zinc-cadmium efflux system membrane fusion protein
MVASIPESDSTFFKIGQPIDISLDVYAERSFQGRIIRIYPTVDAGTHRVMVRAAVNDPNNELRSGMLAEFHARVQEPTDVTAVPTNAVVREADGTMTTWVTTDRRHFSERVIQTGLRQDGHVQVLKGLERGELVVTDGAVFLDNMLQAPLTD